MSAPWEDLLQIPAAFLEAGVIAMDNATRLLKTGVEAVAGKNGQEDRSWTTPTDGPKSVDAALADVASQVIRVGHLTPLGAKDILEGARDVMRTASRSFSSLATNDARMLALPLTVPLSATSLMTDTMARMLAVYRITGFKRLATLMREAMEVYSDTAVFISLKYKDVIQRYEDRLRRSPEDHETRLQLGRLFIKCGLYPDAARELEIVAKVPRMRARATYELLLARYREGKYKEAFEAGVAAMQEDPNNERARNLLWLSSKAAGGYPDSVPVEYRMEAIAGYAKPTVEYDNIAEKVGICKTNSGRGSVIFDYNNDGYLDIAISGPHSGVTLYRNNGDGTFTDVSIESGLDQCINGFALTAGDYDNDGNQDLFVTRLGFYHGQATLYRNNGDGTFTDVTEQAGLANTWGPSFTAHWVDFDCDGKLDLFITYNFAEIFDKHFPNRLFRNNGDGTFTEVTDQSGLFSTSTTIGSSWADYDNDGYPDLFLSCFMGHPMLFHNNGDGTFTDVSAKAGFTQPLLGFVCGFCDYDNDGWPDIAQYVWSDQEDFIHTLRHGSGPPDGHPMRIYHNNRDGTFTALDREIGLDGCWGTMSANMADVNNDGHLDIVLGNGSPRMERIEPPVLMEFDGHKFRNTTFAAGLPFSGKGHAVNFADFFGDGRLSIVIADGGAYPGDLQSTSVYYPKQLPGNYLNVRLTGTKSNRDAVGARITLIAGETRQVRDVNSGTGFGSLPYEQHFGLGKSKKVDALEIRWPNGHLQRVENPPINDTIRITEGESGWVDVYPKRAPKRKTRAALDAAAEA